ncbi:MAG: hypothetical protein RLY71_771 [Pseudomonadota bacterium]|jgi:hypothetical protein
MKRFTARRVLANSWPGLDDLVKEVAYSAKEPLEVADNAIAQSWNTARYTRIQAKTDTMALPKRPEYIEKYKFEPRAIPHDDYKTLSQEEWTKSCEKFGGFNPYTNEITPLKFTAKTEVDDVLNHIVAALEAGVVHRTNWPKQLFSSKAACNKFVEATEEYFNCWRINDRWMMALENLVGLYDEGEGICGEHVAEAFREAIDRH